MLSIEMYNELYHTLVIDRRVDTDEAQCIMTDIEMELEADPAFDAYAYVEEVCV